ncbi:threonine-rich protein-like [Littorina saxatilis]|uniref:threonine-rich protein-like n=1 Tax=Littorina saxatilis TaxID=31220 RepID=UPI0038B6392B
MRSVALIAMLVVMVTCQPHDLQAKASTMAPPPLASFPPSMVDSTQMVTDTNGPPALTDSTVAPMVTDSSAASIMMTDSTAAPVATDSTAAPVISTMAPDVSSAAPISTEDPSTTAAPVDTTALPPATTPAAPVNFYPNIDEIIQIFKSISESEYYKKLSYDDQILLLELLSGGEVGKIQEVMDSQGYERLFNFVYKIPLKYFDSLMNFILASIQREKSINAAMTS